MSDPRIEALAGEVGGLGPEFTRADLETARRWLRLYDLARAYDAAHPQPKPEHPLSHHSGAGWTCGECGAPVAGRFSVCEECGFYPDGGKVGRQPEHREEVVQHSGVRHDDADKSAAPLVGAEPIFGPGHRANIDEQATIEAGNRLAEKITDKSAAPLVGADPPADTVDILRFANQLEEAFSISVASGDREPDARVSKIGRRQLVAGLRLLAAARQPRPITDAAVAAAEKVLDFPTTAFPTWDDRVRAALEAAAEAERARGDG